MNPFNPKHRTAAQPPPNQQVVTFLTAGTLYGLEIQAVKELLAFNGFKPLPESPAYSPGTFDLRGRVVPAVDLRLRLGLEPKDYSQYTVIVVLRSPKGLFGLVVDKVSDVIDLPPDEFQPPPGNALGGPQGHVASVVHSKSGLIYILEPGRLADADLDFTG